MACFISKYNIYLLRSSFAFQVGVAAGVGGLCTCCHLLFCNTDSSFDGTNSNWRNVFSSIKTKSGVQMSMQASNKCQVGSHSYRAHQPSTTLSLWLCSGGQLLGCLVGFMNHACHYTMCPPPPPRPRAACSALYSITLWHPCSVLWSIRYAPRNVPRVPYGARGIVTFGEKRALCIADDATIFRDESALNGTCEMFSTC